MLSRLVVTFRDGTLNARSLAVTHSVFPATTEAVHEHWFDHAPFPMHLFGIDLRNHETTAASPLYRTRPLQTSRLHFDCEGTHFMPRGWLVVASRRQQRRLARVRAAGAPRDTLKTMPARTGLELVAERVLADSRNSSPMPKPTVLDSLSSRCPCPSSWKNTKRHDYTRPGSQYLSQSPVTTVGPNNDSRVEKSEKSRTQMCSYAPENV